MSLQDFQGQAKYKYLVPLIYVLSWISMLVGPWIFPIFYNQYCMLILIYLAIRSFILCGQNAQLVINSHNVLKNAKEVDHQDILAIEPTSMQIYHAFIIPNYKQQAELLQSTLAILSKHKKAVTTYLIFLAMQKHQEESESKAIKLLKKFKNKFRYINYTLHQLQQNQHSGKAANVNWSVQNMKQEFNRLMINQENIFLTVIDADSWVPQIYMNQVENNLLTNLQNRYLVIFQPPQIYTRNCLDVSMLIRTYDDMYSSMHASNLVTCSGISFSLSNYTLSYSLAKRIGFWDTVQQAIGQDMHMCLKSIFKTNGQVKTIPIYIPFNQLNIQTGNGLLSDLKSKFWQVQRHARGVAEIGYCLNMMSKNGFNLKTFKLTLSLIEAFFLPIVTPWPLISIIYMQVLYSLKLLEQKGTFSLNVLFFVVTIANIETFVSNLIYQVFKRRSTSRIYKLQNPHFIRIFEGSLLYTVNLMLITVPAFVCGAFGNLFLNRQYRVTQKASSQLSCDSSLDRE